MSKPTVPEIGKPVLVNSQDIGPASVNAVINPGCYPPGSECVAFLAKDLQTKIGLSDTHQLAFAITTPKKQTLELTVEIATGDYAKVLFLTKTQKFPVKADEKILVGLDDTAADAAQAYFVSGNTITLAVQPKDAGVTVSAGKIVKHGHKKADPARGSR